LIGQNYSRDFQAMRDYHLERVAFDLIRNRAQDRESNFAIIGNWRQHQGGPSASLFVTSLGIESNPYHIASVGGVSHLPHLFSNRQAEVNF
jgi:hypothetical protein